jgi:hypothetical protein
MKSFVPKDGCGPPLIEGQGSRGRNAERDFHGERRRNNTHSSATDRTLGCSARVPQKAKLCHMGQLMTENRQGPIVEARLTEANGTAECAIALDMIEDNAKPGSTVGADEAKW